LLRRSVFFVTCVLIANSAVGQTGQLEIKAPWARATPGQAQNGAAVGTACFTFARARRDFLAHGTATLR
jgi:copper(I)-binding protein